MRSHVKGPGGGPDTPGVQQGCPPFTGQRDPLTEPHTRGLVGPAALSSLHCWRLGAADAEEWPCQPICPVP